jgi:hypothetical protein
MPGIEQTSSPSGYLGYINPAFKIRIVSPNDSLQQKPSNGRNNPADDILANLHVDDTVTAKIDDREVTGKVQRIFKNSENEIIYVKIVTQSGKIHKVDASSIHPNSPPRAEISRDRNISSPAFFSEHKLLSYTDFLLENSDNNSHEETWKKWNSLINMSLKELKDFYESEEGKTAGLKPADAKEAGIDYGRESARMLMKMIPIGNSFSEAESKWSPSMWRWAKKQNSFNSRMLGARKRIKGNPYEKEGKMTRWLKSLLIWGHDPRK